MANEYLQVNNKMVVVDGKLVKVPSETESSNAVDNQSISLAATRGIVEDIENSIVGYINGSPKGVYNSLSELQTTYPNGDSGVYLTIDNGHWWFWNGASWIDGGVYQTPLTPYETYNLNETVNVSTNFTCEAEFISKGTDYSSVKVINGELKYDNTTVYNSNGWVLSDYRKISLYAPAKGDLYNWLHNNSVINDYVTQEYVDDAIANAITNTLGGSY